MPSLSIVIPTLNEAPALAALLPQLTAVPDAEVLVVDGGSADGSAAVAERLGARTVSAAAGRGRQLRAGAAAARSAALWFLHADSTPPPTPRRWIDPVLGRGHMGAFCLRIDDAAARFRWIEAGAWLRTVATGIPYGDQGIFLPRALYDRVGGVPPWPLMEDVELGRRVRRGGGTIELLRAPLRTSARRWRRDGALKRTLHNWSLALRYQALGADPYDLANAYRPEPRP